MPTVNILTLLLNEHRRVSDLFNDLEKTTTRNLKRRQEIYSTIDEALSMHADFEERELYPLLKVTKSSRSIALEAVEEHEQFKRLLIELRELDSQDERWMAKAQVLMEDVRHHVKEEETVAFPQLRKSAGTEILQRLAQEYQMFKVQAVWKSSASVSTMRSRQTSDSPSSLTNSTQRQAKHGQLRTKTKKRKTTSMVKNGARNLRRTRA